MALATGPFTQNLNPGVFNTQNQLFGSAQDGDVESLNQIAGPRVGGKLFVVQTGTISGATTGVFTLGATAAAAIALCGAVPVGEMVTITAECSKTAAAAGVADSAHYVGATATVMNVAGTLTLVGAVTAGDQTHEGTAGDGGVLTIAAGIPTYTVTQGSAVNDTRLRVEWHIKAPNGQF